MRIHILFSILLILIIKESISDDGTGGAGSTTSYVFKIDLKKYEKCTVPSSDRHIIFDSSEFNKDEEIYFKITADIFNKDEILYQFFDDAAAMSNVDFNTYKTAKCSKTDKEFNHGDVVSQTNYYTIKKSERDLGSLEGKYLVIVFNCEGNVLIENTKENEGDTTLIAIIVVVVVVAIVAAICIFCYCRRKKLAAQNAATTNEVYVDNNNQNYNMNMNSGNNVNVYSNNNNYNNNNYNNNNYNNNNYNNMNKNYINNNYMNNNYNSNV